MTVPPYKVLVLTCMVNCTAGKPTPQLCSVVWWSVHWAPSQTTWFLVLAGARHCALETCGKKKMRALLSGFPKSIYYVTCIHFVNHACMQIYLATLFLQYFVQQCGGQCTGLRVRQPMFQSWLGQGVVPLRCAGKKKCKLRFQAWLNLYIMSLAYIL